MKDSDIRAFLAIVECGSISKAAEKLYLSQPTLSRQIIYLEKELGVKLFIRNKGMKNIELTQHGMSFLSLAEKWGVLWKETKLFIEKPIKKRFNLSAVHSINNYIMPESYKRFMERNLDIYLDIQTWSGLDVYPMIDHEVIEGAFIIKTQYSKTVKTVPVFEENMVLVCGNNLPYGDPLSISNLSPDYEIFIPWNEELIKWHEYWFGPYQEPKIHTNNTISLESILSLGSWWAVVPNSMALYLLEKNDNIHVSIIDTSIPKRIGYLALRYDHEPSMELAILLGIIKEVVVEQGSCWLYDSFDEKHCNN